MIAHLWSDDNEHLLIDPASCVNASGAVQCTTYNDFNHLSWLGNKSGITPLFATNNSGKWFCVEAHVKLNDPGLSNGIQEFWIDGQLEARREGLNFVGTYADYAINAIFFENYWNAGSPVQQERYFDNIVVSTKPIGCLPTGVLTPERRQGMMNSGMIVAVVNKNKSKAHLVIQNINTGRYKIVSTIGREVSKGNVSADGYTIVDLSDIPQGVYMATVETGDRMLASRRFVQGR
jgi:hypothetical protein